MIVQVLHNELLQVYMLEGDEKEILLGNQYLSLIKLKDVWHLNKYPGLVMIYYEKIGHGSKLIFEDAYHELYQLRFSMYSLDYYHFKAYERQNLLIGPSVECDVYVQDKSCPLVNFDLAEMRLNLLRDEDVFLNGKQYHGERLKVSDEIQINNLRILIAPDCLLMNQCNNILISAIPKKDNLSLRPEFTLSESVQSGYLVNPVIEPLRIRFPEFTSGMESSSSEFSFSAALMALSALSVGVINSYRQYENGKSLIDLLPYLLMPFVMVVSSLIIFPLMNFIKSRKIKKKEEKRFLEYQNEIARIHDRCSNYKESCALVYEAGLDVFEEYLRSLSVFGRKGSFKLHLGIGRVAIPVEFENLNYELEPDFESYRYIDNGWICIDFKDSKWVSIVDGTNTLYKHFLLELTSQYRPDSYLVVFVGDLKDLYRRLEVWFVEASYYHGIHLCAWNRESLRRIEGLLKECELPVFYVMFNHDLLPEARENNYYLLFEECIYAGCDEAIEFDGNRGIYKTMTNSQQFVLDTKNIDLLQGLQRVFSSKNTEIVQQYHQEVSSSLIEQAYKRNRAYEGLRVVVGVDQDGNEVSLDLSERGQGPHCLLAGTTGSGKSIFLINWILQLVMKYSPDQVQFALIDFKGGSLISIFENNSYHLPHLRGALSNLAISETERVLIALKKECSKREALFIQMQEISGKHEMNLDVYMELNEKNHRLEKLAHLIVIVDEFAELKSMYPEAMDELISLSRIGRSLGIHLVLCTQKPAGVVNEQIWSNARLKICLKVGSKADSQEMIESSDAVGLRNPGEFFAFFDNQRLYGKSFFPFESLNKEENQVEIIEKNLQLDELHKRVFEKGKDSSFLEKVIMCIPEGNSYLPLWMEPLDKVTYNPQVPCVGIIDDIIQIKQIPWCIRDEGHLLILYEDRNELDHVFDLMNEEIGHCEGTLLYFGEHVYSQGYIDSMSYDKESLCCLIRSVKENMRVIVDNFASFNRLLMEEGVELSKLMEKIKFVFCFHVMERIAGHLLNGCSCKLSLVTDKSVLMDCFMVSAHKIKDSNHSLLFKGDNCYSLCLCTLDKTYEITNKELIRLNKMEHQILPEERLVGKNLYSLEKVFFKTECPYVTGNQEDVNLFMNIFGLANRDVSIRIDIIDRVDFSRDEGVEIESKGIGYYWYRGKKEVIQLVGFERSNS